LFDPNEAHNLIADPLCAEIAFDLRSRLELWMRMTGDPLLQGPVAPPSGAHYNHPDARSAGEPTLVAP
jgi:hypothetical protein